VNWAYVDNKELVVMRTLENGDVDSRSINDWEVQQYIADGGIIDPYVPPKPTPQPLSTDEIVFFNHENRIRAIEGKEPVSVKDFFELRTKMKEN
jgi:hypothetical protein